MDANRNNSKKMFEAVINAVRSSEPDRMDMENRAARVWSRIGQEFQEREKTSDPNFSSVPKFTSCNDYRVLIPDYIAGRLSSAQTLLFTDHTHECVACRNALNVARGEAPPARPIARNAGRYFNRTAVVLAVAASLIVGLALQQTGYLNFLLPVLKVNAIARTIDGHLYRIAGLNMAALRTLLTERSGSRTRPTSVPSVGSKRTMALAPKSVSHTLSLSST